MPEQPPVTIPETITVHLGTPASDAQNITVPFAEYIKNVASSEIYPTWPEEAIRANIYAQVSYALNRVFTEWYRSQGYDFDITNSTRYDQSFVPGRDIFENISTIVDGVFNDYLTRGDAVEPLFAQYCSGTTVTCPGGLSQWGTVPLAEQGMRAEEIVRYFYGDDINFINDAPVSPNLGGSWPGTVFRLGDVGEDVRTIQRRLNRISVNYPGIPKIYPTNGVFDANTERAVRTFQQQFNLTADGLVGKATWYRIANVYNNVKRLSELNSEGLRLEDISRQYPSELREGMTGVSVQLLQYFLAVAGAYYDQLPTFEAAEIDGIFGPKTREAVQAYQRMLGLPVTGAVNRETWNALVSTYQSVLRARPLEQTLPGAIGLPAQNGAFLVEGMRGEAVRELQLAINVAARAYANIPAVTADGIFGPKTRDAVAALQQMFGLPETGAVGPLTWEALGALVRDILASSQTAEGQYPGYPVGEEANT
ncbi:MAG: peptidoglycan-binding protein [Agathobaculum sp.]|uniref:peptidoglycan-binding protein n=1 Tax=Agathobaculum sp. TaxID=2048138 RepID=UPI003D8A1595